MNSLCARPVGAAGVRGAVASRGGVSAARARWDRRDRSPHPGGAGSWRRCRGPAGWPCPPAAPCPDPAPRIGARLIEERKIRRTATEASLEDQSYHSILGHIAYNVSQALTSALRLYALYSGITAAVSIKLNDDFSTISSDAEHRRLLLEEYIAGTRTFAEYRAGLRTYDANVTEDDEQAKKDILKEAKDFKKVIAESTMQKPAEAAPKGDNRTKPKQPTKVED